TPHIILLMISISYLIIYDDMVHECFNIQNVYDIFYILDECSIDFVARNAFSVYTCIFTDYLSNYAFYISDLT
ncbi:MAG: hypothetical protein ACPF9R_04240, partial [Acholeplasmataceae bacterium]